jgi:hypothetical protein
VPAAVETKPAPQPEPAAAPRPWMYAAASAVALIPCFWQSRIQAGDLASHVYNAWLAQLIQQGKAPGLAIVPQLTNVLFDWILSALFRAFGAAAAERIAVSIAVLVFVWGAFAFCRAVSGRAWPVFPVILAVAYGWVFHMGFFNFYLGLGLSFWALALAWSFRPRGLAAAAVLFAVAGVAHGLPVVWALGVLAYAWICRRWSDSPWWRLGFGIAAILALRIVLSATVMTRWKPSQFQFCWGAGEVWVYPTHVAAAALALGLLWGIQIAVLAQHAGARRFFGGPIFQVCALTAVGIVAIPDWINLTWYQHPLVFLSERTSLPLAICLCALVAAAPMRRWYAYAAGAVALLFFTTLFLDESSLNGFEDAEEALLAGLPPMQRVISAVEMPDEHVNALTHMVDRLCVGRCYSWANYEPATAQFRIRVVGPQSIVAPVDEATWRVQAGTYLVQPKDLPLYQVEAEPTGNVHLRSLPAGDYNRLTLWDGMR